MSTEPNKTTGQYHSVKVCRNIHLHAIAVSHRHRVPSLKPSATSLGQPPGSRVAKKSTLQIQAAKAKGYAEGTMDRIEGKKDAVVGAITGDKQQQAQGNLQHDKGQAQQELNH
ncbi:CsbD domain-containing protein [Rhizoctonia solani AG-1 IA]|uniref:CsbD domain-containing protein n=1 Tax=Thanatephorus cucumeris (strain AG1-IA) TaxID=983506 RepID=L8WJH9_THACA|nr:CsbD domain-containing protein [Rhizoctonia solani AG-1 IA]